mmetsp:Transcript_34247/g.67426  ORF Transcript_34247/g.67426 Transcript_34247/m.67426 type:complete len:1185 (-) Transcript_34247:312-3866(-)|eukprot:CAMPEP_0175136972 /NCGR_PEP_ID=MMETSP0087-20121206/9564_1 /TAXON_ID=136419 /ORGANISM="Unknown Unknown, Strain D1" /LENGTH=1184 /DNA_ID=CAMNT_0016419771 /DNA_START=24 /DNA_END=3578 /DNA_ORIENTATION=-
MFKERASLVAPVAPRIQRRMHNLAPMLCAASAGSPPFNKLLVANRGEIAIRIFKACKALGVKTVAVYAAPDKDSLHVSTADEAFLLPLPEGQAIAPYLQIEQVLKVAKDCGADAIHPGYGFLAESAEFSAACRAANVKFVGPTAETITLFGDKTAAKNLAIENKVPVAAGSQVLQSGAEAVKFVKDNKVPYPILIKACYGGGGRGQKLTWNEEELLAGFESCSKEALLTFGDGACFVEEFVQGARHIEVQVLADEQGNVVTLYERDCSVQLRNQKVVEVAPARDMCAELRDGLHNCAKTMAAKAKYWNAGTVEFLVMGELSDPATRYIFLEMNPRIQVEHTITEEVTKVDIVQAQIRIAAGASLPDLAITQDAHKVIKAPHHGWSMQLRITLMPGKEGVLTVYEPPTGAGLRVDSGVCQGRTPSSQYDPMIAKLIVSVDPGKTFEDCIAKSLAALSAFKIEGVKLNLFVLENILNHPDFAANKILTTFMTENQSILFKVGGVKKSKGKKKKKKATKDPVLQTLAVESPFPGQVTEVLVRPGDKCKAGQVLVVVSAMKMLNEITSPVDGDVKEVTAVKDTQIDEGQKLCVVEGFAPADEEEDDEDDDQPRKAAAASGGAGFPSQLYTTAWFSDENTVHNSSKPSSAKIKSKVKVGDDTFKRRVEHNTKMLEEYHRRLKVVSEGGGEKYVKTHRKRGKMLPRERINMIIDEGTKFLELSALAAWGQYGGKIHSAAMVCGIGVVHGVECMFLVNDATVKGGVFWPETAKKQLRAQEIAQTNHLPCIYLVDGGGANLGGGKGSASEGSAAQFVMGGLQFKNQAVMSSMKIPQISAVLGKCTAGGAYIPAMSDESVIVKGNGSIYLGGPPLVKAATGEDADEESLGGAAMHTGKSGVADHMANTEEEALKKVRQIVEHLARRPRHVLPMAPPEPPAYSPEELLGIIPEDNKFPYDVREVIARIVDGSRFHEFKPRYGPTLVTGFAHVHGFPIGIVANNGMLFSESAIKGTHFIQVCGQRGIPLVFLHNITGFMVGTVYEQGGIAKDGAKMIMAVSCAPVPKISIVLGGSHGAGNYAMCGPAFDPRFTFLWPNSKISVMGGKQAADVITIVKDKQLKREGKPPLSDKMKKMMQAPIIKQFEAGSTAYDSTRAVFDDGIIDPRDTRDVLAQAISISLNAPYPNNGYGVFRM